MAYDYYKILGLAASASCSTVHAQYRKLAPAVHPEKEHADPHAAKTRFLELGEAYDVLRNPVLRELYDNIGNAGLTSRLNAIPGHPFGYRYHGNPMRTFEEHFGTIHAFADAYEQHESAHDYHLFADIFRPRAKGRLPPLVIGLEVTLEELFYGNIRELEFTRNILGPEGEIAEELVVKDVYIKPGWPDGTQILYPNEGHQMKNMETSDVIVQIIELPHERFFHQGIDLRMRIEVDLLVALCGGDITLTSIDDTPIRIEETNVIKPGSVRMIPGYGMPDSKNPAIRGDLHLDYTVLFPRDMDTARREMVANALRNRPTNVTIPTTLVGISGYEPGKSFINFGGGSPEDPSTGVDFKREQSVVSSVWEPEAAGTGNDE